MRWGGWERIKEKEGRDGCERKRGSEVATPRTSPPMLGQPLSANTHLYSLVLSGFALDGSRFWWFSGADGTGQGRLVLVQYHLDLVRCL